MWNRFIVIHFIVFSLIIGSFIMFIKPKAEFSILENRDLAAVSHLSVKSWLSADFQMSVESVLADHFISRNKWVQGYNLMQISFNRLGGKVLDRIQNNPVTQKTTLSSNDHETEKTTGNSETQSSESQQTESSPNETSSEMTSNPTGPIVEGTGLEDNDGQLDNDVFGIDTTDNEISPNTPFTLTKLNNQVNLMSINGEDRLIRSSLVYDQANIQSVQKSVNFINQFRKDINSEYDVFAYFVMSPHHSKYVYPDDNIDKIMPIIDQLEVPHDYFKINSISDVVKNYLRTDHHWNSIGSYKGYRELIKLVCGDDEKIYSPVDRYCFNDFPFYGTLSRETAFSVDVTPDILCKLVFKLPPYQLTVDGDPRDEYGNLSYYISGDASREKGYDHYNFLFQKRAAEIKFDTGRSDLKDILVISDSMSNPIRELIASHFNKSYFVSLDIMHIKDPFFKIESYMDDNQIDQVVFFLSFDNLMTGGEMQYAN